MGVTTETQPRLSVKKHHIVEFLQFGIVGGSGFFVNMAVFIVLSKIFAPTKPEGDAVLIPLLMDKNFRVYHLMSTFAFVVANIWNFELNRVWTFRRGGKSSRKRFSRYFVIGAIAQGVGLIIMSFLLHASSPIHLPFDILDDSSGLRNPKYWAQLIQIFATMPVSFVLQKIWTFASHEVPDPDVPAGPADALAQSVSAEGHEATVKSGDRQA